jgi:hypothetical protein
MIWDSNFWERVLANQIVVRTSARHSRLHDFDDNSIQLLTRGKRKKAVSIPAFAAARIDTPAPGAGG